ncbi:hypothetical protein SAMN04515655_1448 [Halanaerobium congolense]|jgi:hypothetical protein|uniref:Uncharacterized protein n=1 Tax=Halanaerobium congolense TaxID=54121 RepID=A0A1G6QV32_9FIRM|nr:MAG: hypothetical protein CI949_2374 [Halanaerobium sp.]PXV64209.1 hypothetical protein C8C78_11950 [Halanaerobium congolense]TDS24316.1 hypothetical protein BY453_1731 [Halanaerobium congolense]SDC96188.1 hypothetical protein SAMN04488597_1207 [Halanaerobium congolense]SDL01627.1 hypothetical protein SAMN04515655_1448 [Halanaerobium congolense]
MSTATTEDKYNLLIDNLKELQIIQLNDVITVKK